MAVLSLERLPAQSLSFVAEGVRVDLRLFTLSDTGGMAADVSINGAQILAGMRLVYGEPVIPFEYLEAGNLIFVTDGNEPWWENFGRSQWLVYLTEADIDAA